MRARIFISVISCVLSSAFAQDRTDITICCTSPAEKFACFAHDNTFMLKHSAPRSYVHKTKNGGKVITFTCPDGSKANGYLILSEKKTSNWIFIFHEWWGLNDNIKKWAEDLYSAVGNVNILALDMYDGKMATNRDSASAYMQSFKQKRGKEIILGALAYVGPTARIGTIGWCFGGGQSLQAAITMRAQTIACVMYYGMPEENIERLKMLNSDVLNIWAKRDKWINQEVIDRFKENMQLAGKELTIYAYDAEHAFANPSNTIFDKEAYEDARQKTITYFKTKMQ